MYLNVFWGVNRSWHYFGWVQSFECEKPPDHLISWLPGLTVFTTSSLVTSFSLFGDWSYFSSTSTCNSPSRCYFPLRSLLSLLASTRPSILLKNLQTSASWLCVSLISFCQAFVFDHRSSVSTLLLLLSTSFPPKFFWLPATIGVCLCACVPVSVHSWRTVSCRTYFWLSLHIGEWFCVWKSAFEYK